MSSDDAPRPEDKPVEFDPSPLNGEMHKELERLAEALRLAEASRNGWKEDCERQTRNTLYYMAQMDRIAKHLGPEVFVADDGSVSEDPIRAKIPEMVASMAYDLSEAKNNYKKACVTIAEMFEAATGRHGEGPQVGVVQDVRQVRLDKEKFESAAKQVLAAYEKQSFELRETKDGKRIAYWERNQLVSALSKLFPASLERHQGAGWEDDWRWIVMIIIPTGQLSWHIHDSDLGHFDHLERQTKKYEWDGHTTNEKYDRLRQLRGVVGGDLNLIRTGLKWTGDLRCSAELVHAGLGSPRTCKICGLGPCNFGHKTP